MGRKKADPARGVEATLSVVRAGCTNADNKEQIRIRGNKIRYLSYKDMRKDGNKKKKIFFQLQMGDSQRC